MENQQEFEVVYRRVLAGTATPDEVDLVARWMSQMDIGEMTSQEDLDNWHQRSLEQLKGRVEPPVMKRVKGLRQLRWLGRIAGVLVLLGAVWMLWPQDSIPPVETLAEETVFEEQVTASGQRKLVTLADGTKIWMGNESKIRYPQQFHDTKREIYLEGQAFFEVESDPNRPFIVSAGGLEVHVLGTSFEVRSHEREAEQTVTVSTGLVSVTPSWSTQGWVLEPGQQLVNHPLTKTVRVSEVDLSSAFAWKEGELIFKKTPMEEVAIQLGRWYGADVSVADNLKTKEMSLSVKDQPLGSVLRMLSLAGGFQYEIAGDSVKIWN